MRKKISGEKIRDSVLGGAIPLLQALNPFTRVARGINEMRVDGEGESFQERTSVSFTRGISFTATG
jgi:hypothetical protein